MPLTWNQGRLAALRAALAESGAGGVVLCIGETANLAGNSRTAALLMRLFDAPTTPANVAVAVSATACTVFSKGATVASAAEVTVVTSSDAFAAAVSSIAGLLVFQKELGLSSDGWAQDVLKKIAGATGAATDATAMASRFLLVKEKVEIEHIKKASAVAAFGFKRFAIDRLKKALSSALPPAEAALSADFDEVMAQPDKIPELAQMDTTDFGAAFTPTPVQSNPNHFHLQLHEALAGVEPSALPLRRPCITVALGAKHKGYAAQCARTFLVQPCAPALVAAYEFLHAVFEHALQGIVVGTSLKDLHARTLAFAQMTNASLAAKLTNEFGFATGLHFGDVRSSISARAEHTICNGMVAVLRIALINVTAVDVKAEGAAEEPYGLVLADTVVIEEGKAKATTKVDRKPAEVTWAAIEVKQEKKVEAAPYVPRVTRGATGVDEEYTRKEQQRVILQQKREAWVQAGRPQGIDAEGAEDTSAIGRLARGSLQAYTGSIPTDIAKQGLAVDRTRMVLVCPIGGELVPFHISTIAKAAVANDGHGKTVLTITFATTQPANPAFHRHRTRQWVKEITFARTDGTALFEVSRAIAEVQKMIKEADSRSKMSSGLAQAEAIKLDPRALRLPSVKVRPPPVQMTKGQTALNGNLDAHVNGFRFSYSGGVLDVPYSNIKHFIYQPARKDLVVVLHLHFRQPMMIGAKKCDDVQFIAEVLESSVAVSGARKTHDEELEAEERDIERVKETNKQFALYAKTVSEQKGLPLDLPLSGEKFRFQAVANRRQMWFHGNENALWTVSDLPFCVVSLDSVEIVALERVIHGQLTFDAMFIHKDYKNVTQLTNIPMTHLEAFKEWLCYAKVVYFESTANIAWSKTILKTMRDDKEWEAWGPGGWVQYVDPDADEEGEGGEDSDEDADDTDYEESSEDEEEDEEEDSEWAEEGSSTEASADDSDDSDGGSGSDSWDEVERKAVAADKKRAYDSDDSDRPKRSAAKPPARPGQPSRPQPPARR